jgi:hypothetical protein
VLRAEVIPGTLTRSTPTGPSGLAMLSSVLCTKERVGLAQTSHSSNQQIVLLPPFVVQPGTDAVFAAQKKKWWAEVKSHVDEMLTHRVSASGVKGKGASIPGINGTALFAPADSSASDAPISFYLLCILRDPNGPNLRTHLGMGEAGCSPAEFVNKPGFKPGDLPDDVAKPDTRGSATIPAPKTYAKWAADKGGKKPKK